MKGYQVVLAVGLVLLIALSSGFTGYSIGKAKARDLLFKRAREHMMGRFVPEFGRERNPRFGEGVRGAERMERFREFAREHPGRFDQMMEDRKESIRERLAKLKREDPERYNEVLQRMDRLERTIEEIKRELGQPPSK